MKNVYLDNVTCQQSRYGVYIAGFEDSANVSDINLLNCEWNNVKQNNRIEGKIERIKFENTRINSEPVKN